MTEHVLQAVVVAGTVVKLWALGRKYRWGWMLAIVTEGPWIALAILWGSWGMIALSALYLSMSLKNWFAWKPKES